MDECKNGQKNFLATRAKISRTFSEKVGAKLRAMMPWIGKKKLVDSDKKLNLTIRPIGFKKLTYLTIILQSLTYRLYYIEHQKF